MFVTETVYCDTHFQDYVILGCSINIVVKHFPTNTVVLE